MTQIKRPHYGEKHFCEECEQDWEWGFDNKVMYCRECPYNQPPVISCLKKTVAESICPVCTGEIAA